MSDFLDPERAVKELRQIVAVLPRRDGVPVMVNEQDKAAAVELIRAILRQHGYTKLIEELELIEIR